MRDIDVEFKRYFPDLNFKLKCFQKNVIENVTKFGNTLCIMPTGGGKSVIYWMAAMECDGIAIVISPLTALIEEQASKLRAQGYEVLVFHSGINSAKQVEVLTNFAQGNINPKFIFVSPEKIATDGYFEFCLKKRSNNIHLMVIDEVHCVSQWGMSFRPFYKRIPEFLNCLFGVKSWCKVLALTATLNPLELGDICAAFHIERKKIIKDKILMRNEIQLHVNKFANEDEKEDYFWTLLKRHAGEKILVYLYRKKGERGVEGLYEKAISKGYNAGYFHGDMVSAKRMELIERYRSGEIDVMFATNAFGMGIDISDIRVVIHFMIPESAEQYYQEVGRAARDGYGANAYLLYSNKNIDVKRTHFINNSFPKENELRDVYKKIAKKVGYVVCPYFEDETIQKCLPYYLKAGLLNIECKGFSGIAELYDIENLRLKKYYESTKSKGFVRTLKKNNIDAEELSNLVYDAVFSGDAKLNKPLERWLVFKINSIEITDDKMQLMLKDIEEKKKYKNELLDYLIYILEENDNSQKWHQDIAAYLGMDKYELGRIYTTVDGNHVRSKSEVIICDLLAKSNIQYKYEERLEYEPGQVINPDFTVYLADGRVFYWEHLGCLGQEVYDDNWAKKMKVYEEYFPGKLVKTYESGTISKDAERLIKNIFSLRLYTEQ